ncbi:MAG: hypothetical protein HUJ42_01390 [Malacoplasma sp.]|nr:hypothetical protein [Malacoplasma sp.]
MKNFLNLKPLSITNEEQIKVKGTAEISKAIDYLTSNKRMSLKFELNYISSDFAYHGLKIIVCEDPGLMVRELLNQDDSYSRIKINQNLIRNKNVYHFHHFSKISDFINNKNNSIFHEYLKKKDIYKLNQEFQDFITAKYYDFNDENIEAVSDINFEKASLLSYIDVFDDYLSDSNIDGLLNIIKEGSDDKQLILINDFNILDISKILNNYLSSFNFLIFTNNLKKWITDFSYIECIVIVNEFVNKEFKVDALEILDKTSLIEYIEKNFKNQKEINKKLLNSLLY